MPSRGVFRGLHSVLLDDLDYQALPPHARLVLLTLRICRDVGLAGIFHYTHETLMRQTGLSRPAVSQALMTLEAGQWIVREGPLLWIRNALRYDPNVRLADPKHRRAIQTWLTSLPRLSIVLSFCDYYDLPRPFPRVSDDPSMTHSIGDRREEIGKEDRSKEGGVGGDNPPHTAPDRFDASLTPQQLVDLYNAESPDECPSVQTLSAKRLEHATKLLRQFPDPAWWRETFRQIHRSKFLRGLVPATPGHDRPFVADLDWLLANGKQGTENAVLVHDGRYARGPR